MRAMLWRPVLVAAMGTVVIATGGQATDRMLGLVPSDGVAMLVNQFSVRAGTTITGAQFANNDRATLFPSVVLLRGSLGSVSEGTVIASVANVQESSGGGVTVLWPTPVVVSEAGTYYVAVRIPAGPGKQAIGRGPAIGAIVSIEFGLAADAPEVGISVYDVSGRLVRALVLGAFDRGAHSIAWDGRDGGGADAAVGVYFVRLQVGRDVLNQKVLLAR